MKRRKNLKWLVKAQVSVPLIITLVLWLGIPLVTHAQAFGGFGDFASTVGGAISDATFGWIWEDIGYLILTLANIILFLVGTLFNFVLEHTVFEFGNFFGNSAGLLAAWGILRDIANIGLLFGFVFIGIATILDIHGYEVKKTLPRLIIFAVLMNFSLLASEGVIDVANAFGSVLYTQVGSTCVTGNDQTCAQDVNTGISGKIFQSLGLSSILSKPTSLTGPAISDATLGTLYVSMAIFITVTSVVLLAGAIILITRAVALVFLMVLSPLGFAGLAIPPLVKYGMDWWHRLLSQAFLAPLYLLFIFIGLKIAQGFTGQGQNILLALLNGDVGAIGAVFIFAVLTGFMVAALVMAKQMGAIGANFAINLGRQVVSAPFVPGALGVQWGASKTRNWYNEKIGQLEKSGKGGKFAVGAMRLAGLDQGIDSALKKTASAKIGGFASYEDRRKELEERKKATGHAAEIAELKDALTEAIRTGDTKNAEKIAQKLNQHGVEEALKQCNEEQLEVLGKILSAEMYGKLMDSKDVSPEAQHAMGHGRFGQFDGLTTTGISAMAAPDREDLQKKIRDMGTKDAELLAKYDANLFGEMVKASNDKKESLFNDEQNKFVAKSERVARNVRDAAKQNTRAGRVEEWTTGSSATATSRNDAKALFKSMQGDAQAEVKAQIIVDHLIDEVDVDGGQAIVAGNKFNRAQLDKLATSWKTTTDPAKKVRVANFSVKNGLASAVIGI